MRFIDKIKTEPVTFMSIRMWKHSKGIHHLVILFLFLSFLSNIVWLLPALVFGQLLNELQLHGLTSVNISYFYLLLAGLFSIEILGWFFHGPSRVIENVVAFKTDRNYKKYLYNAVMYLPLSWHSDHDSGDTIDKVNKATDSLFEYSKHTFNILRVFVKAIGTAGILIYFNLYIGLLAMFILVLAFIVIFNFDLKLIPQYKLLNIFGNKSSAKVYDSISNVTTIKVLGIENPILESINKSWNSPFELYKKNKILVELKWFSGSVFFTLLVGLPLGLYIYYQYSHSLPILVGTVSTLYLYLSNLSDVYYTFAGMYEDMMIQKSRLQNVESIEQEFEKRSRAKRKVFHSWKNFEIKNLNFNYEDNIKVVDDLSLNLVLGEKIAIIGESGSGKSTLLKLFHGMYENVEARISIDDKEIKKTDLAHIDLASTLVPQEPEVFSASILENLTLLIEFSDEEIQKAIEIAMFTDVVENLPKKLASVINEKGVNLSGGQKQRLALARALLFSAGKKLILLDESTSSVDPINEVKIYQNIFENFKDSTILASIHKMNLLKYFDRILIMESGKIVDQGSFDYLLANNIDFRNSWEEYRRQEGVEKENSR